MSSKVWWYVFQSATGNVSIGTELLGRECAYMSRSHSDALTYARKLKTSQGATSRKECLSAGDSLDARGRPANLRTASYIDASALVVSSTAHIPQRRISA